MSNIYIDGTLIFISILASIMNFSVRIKGVENMCCYVPSHQSLQKKLYSQVPMLFPLFPLYNQTSVQTNFLAILEQLLFCFVFDHLFVSLATFFCEWGGGGGWAVKFSKHFSSIFFWY